MGNIFGFIYNEAFDSFHLQLLEREKKTNVFIIHTLCPRSHDPSYIKWVKTS